MPNNESEKWIPVMDVDPEKRKPEEWARIYVIKLREPVSDDKVSEYEWAYMLWKTKFFPAAIPDTQQFDIYEAKLHRADELRRDIFMGAEPYEREILNEKYVETRWVHNRLRF